MPFTRRYATRPSAAVLTQVSGVVIIDDPPPVAANAAPFGKVCVVGEFEDGPFNTPTDLLTSTDQPTIFGGLGYTYGGLKYQYAAAVQSGGYELWNGNGWVQTSKLKWGGLCFCRVDTSVGQIALSPLPFVSASAVKPPFNVTPGQTLIWKRDGSTKTATFAGTYGTVTGTSTTFSFAGGEQLAISINGAAPLIVTFQASDNTAAAVVARINAAAGFVLSGNASGHIVISSYTYGSGSSISIAPGTATTILGLSTTTSTGTGDGVNLAALTLAEMQAKVTAVDANTSLQANADGTVRLVSLGGTSMQVMAGTANAALGFVDQTAGSATTGALTAAVTIPAGTRLSVGGVLSTRVVTMQTTTIAAGTSNVTLLKVRPANDNGTYPGQGAGSTWTVEDSPGGIPWYAANPSNLNAALTTSQLDSAYVAAINATIGPGSAVTKRISGITAARHSATIAGALINNAATASGSGHNYRRAFLAPSIGASASSAIAGVVNYRSENGTMSPGGVACFLQELIDGGYSTDGKLSRRANTMMASRWSCLTPGYNPGQLPEDPSLWFDKTAFYGLDATSAVWDITTYAAFKAAGLSAAQFDSQVGLVFEQGVTTVDPNLDPSHVDIARATLAGFIGDSLTGVALFQSKRQGSIQRRDNLKMAFEGFLQGLVGDTISSYKVVWTTDNQPNHVVLFTIAVDMIQSDDVIILNLKVSANSVELLAA